MKEKKEQFAHLDASMRRAIEAGLNAATLTEICCHVNSSVRKG